MFMVIFGFYLYFVEAKKKKCDIPIKYYTVTVYGFCQSLLASLKLMIVKKPFVFNQKSFESTFPGREVGGTELQPRRRCWPKSHGPQNIVLLLDFGK